MTSKKIGIPLLLFIVTVLASEGRAAGKRPTPIQDGSCGDTTLKTPNPVRMVSLNPVETSSFRLPNGDAVNLGVNLGSILYTSVNSTGNLRPNEMQGSPRPDPEQCDHHLELNAAVTTLQLKVAEFGVTFGYTPQGVHNPITSIHGKADVSIGTITMDFRLKECDARGCQTYVTSMADQTMLGSEIKFEVDFGQANVGAGIVTQTPLGRAFRKMMDQGLLQIAISPQLNRLPWHARVKQYSKEAGTLIFDAGFESNLGKDEAFTVFSVSPSIGVCDVFRPVANVHTQAVDFGSSTAVVDEFRDEALGIHERDVVRVRVINKTGNPRESQ